ncbi:MAG: alginate lyase family protein [Bryobacterales bacterium]|nr:alginate lyase family protein [Bryobacterales bacterium]
MRSARGLAFRLKQEAADLWLLASPPRLSAETEPAPLRVLPDPAPVVRRLRSSRFAGEVIRLAGEVLAHRFPLLGRVIDTGAEIDWRRDYVHQVSTGPVYARRIPYLDFARAGDHKFVWELNRHQHLVLLAQAWLFTSDGRYRDEIFGQLENWLDQNPFLKGMNWASSLEVAFRSLSWVWVYHWTGHAMERGLRRRFLEELYRHAVYLEHNLSIHFSPNTHLLGEAAALHALGTLFPAWPGSHRRRRLGREIVLAQMDSQVLPDGFHFERSVYYHVYALDMFVLHHLLEPAPGPWLARLRRMAECLDVLMGPARLLPQTGDDDGGRLFHPYGERLHFGRATLATCARLFPEAGFRHAAEDLAEQAAWWLGEPALRAETPAAAPRTSTLLPDAGLAVMKAGETHIVIDCGPFGAGNAGHRHAGVLGLSAWRGDQEILIDPGTFTYVGDARLRDWFRGTAAHNTIRIGGLDQATPAGPFRWINLPEVTVRSWRQTPDSVRLDASCRYRGLTHRRRFLLLEQEELLLIWDEVAGPPDEREIEQFWHLGSAEVRARLCLADAELPAGSEAGEHGWRSTCFGWREPAPVVCLRRRGLPPLMLAAALDLSAEPQPASLSLEPGGALRWRAGGRDLRVNWPDSLA